MTPVMRSSALLGQPQSGSEPIRETRTEFAPPCLLLLLQNTVRSDPASDSITSSCSLTVGDRGRSAWLPVVLSGLSLRADGSPARGDRGCTRARRAQTDRSGVCEERPFRPPAAAHGRLGAIPQPGVLTPTYRLRVTSGGRIRTPIAPRRSRRAGCRPDGAGEDRAGSCRRHSGFPRPRPRSPSCSPRTGEPARSR